MLSYLTDPYYFKTTRGFTRKTFSGEGKKTSREVEHLTQEAYDISRDPARLNIDLIYDFLTHSYWAAGITRPTVQKSIENSICFGVYDQRGEQVGFARILTEKARVAHLSDLFILEPHRGKGLAKRLMRTILEDPELHDVPKWFLITEDAHELYRRYGFECLTPAQAETYMIRKS